MNFELSPNENYVLTEDPLNFILNGGRGRKININHNDTITEQSLNSILNLGRELNTNYALSETSLNSILAGGADDNNKSELDKIVSIIIQKKFKIPEPDYSKNLLSFPVKKNMLIILEH